MCAYTHAHTSYPIQALDGLVFPHSTVSADWRVPAQLLFQCLSCGVHVSQLGVVLATVPRDWPKPMASLPVPSQCSTLSTHLPVASVLLGPSKPVHKPQQRPSGERESKGDSDTRRGHQFIFCHLQTSTQPVYGCPTRYLQEPRHTTAAMLLSDRPRSKVHF